MILLAGESWRKKSSEEYNMGILDSTASTVISTGIMTLKATNPNAWAAFKKSMKCIAVAVGALNEIFDDDTVTAEEINKVMDMAQDYGAARTLQDMLWGVLKHIK